MTSEPQKPLLLSIWHRIKDLFLTDQARLNAQVPTRSSNSSIKHQVHFLEKCLSQENEEKSVETKRYGSNIDSLWLEHCWYLDHEQKDVSA